MTEEEWPEELQKIRAEMVRQAIIGMDQKPSFAKRLEYLEADASAQRTAILRLEKIARLLFKSVCALGVMCAALAVLVLT
jgi:hypothetical protein